MLVKSRKRNYWKWAACLLAGACLIVVLELSFARQILCVESAPTIGDCIVVLGGDTDARTDRAAELFNQGAAPMIIMTGTGDCEEGRLNLINHGVPERSIELECKAK